MTRQFKITLTDDSHGQIICQGEGNLSVAEIVASLQTLQLQLLLKGPTQNPSAALASKTVAVPTIEPKRF